VSAREQVLIVDNDEWDGFIFIAVIFALGVPFISVQFSKCPDHSGLPRVDNNKRTIDSNNYNITKQPVIYVFEN
jgi:hypothetical protein